MSGRPSVVDQIIAAYDAPKQQFRLAADTLGSADIANLIQTYFGETLLLTSASAPAYDELGEVVRLSGELQFCPPGTSYHNSYATQAVFAAREARDANDPHAWMIGLTLQIDPASWSFGEFFPGLAQQPLASLQLEAGSCLALASHDHADRSVDPPVHVEAGASLRGKTKLGSAFELLGPFFPTDQASDFIGRVTFGAADNKQVFFDLAVTTPIATPILGYEADFFAQLSGQTSLEEFLPTVGTVRLGVQAHTSSGTKVELSGLYDPNRAQIVLALGSPDDAPIALADLAGLLPPFVRDGLSAAIPLDKLQTIGQVSKVFQLQSAAVAFDLGRFALSSLSTTLQIVPDAAGYGTVHIDLAIGSIVLENIRLDVGVSYPFQNPSWMVNVAAAMNVAGVPLIATASTNGELGLRLAPDSQLDIAPVFSRFTGLPAASMPALAFRQLALDINLSDYSMGMFGVLAPLVLPWGRQQLTLSDLSARFNLLGRSEAAGSKHAYAGSITGTAQALGTTAQLTMAVDEDWRVHFALEGLRLANVIQALTGATHIPYVPDGIYALDLTVALATRAISFRVAIENLSFPSKDPVVRLRTVTLRFDQRSPDDWALSLELIGSAALGAAIEIDTFALTLEYDKALEQWTTRGSVNARLFDASAIELSASYTHTADGDALTLGYHANVGLLDLAGLQLGCSNFEFHLVRHADSGYEAGAAATGRIRMGDRFDVGGTLVVEASAARQAVTLTVTHGGEVVLPLASIGDLHLGLKLTVASFSLAHSSQDGWSVESTAAIEPTGMPAYLIDNGIVPRRLANVTFRASSSGVALMVPGTITDIPTFDIPPLDIGGKTVDLNRYGPAALCLRDLRVTLGKDLLLTVTLAIALPERLDEVFGTKDGKAVVAFFVKPPKTVDIRFSVGLRGGSPIVLLSLETLPFLSSLVRAEGDHWLLDLGECGQLRAQTPELSFTGTRFVFRGGLSGLRTLKIPLSPLKDFLSAVGAGAIADVIPSEPVGIRDIHVLDARGNFDPSELIRVLEAVLPHAVAGPIENALVALGEYGDRLPAPLKRYFDFTMIDGIQWNISVAGSACVDIDIAIGDPSLPRDQRIPLQIIFPTMVGPMPGLQGIRFYGFSFGALMGGTLFSLRVDADFDQFDLASLAAAVSIPKDSGLPIARDFHRTVVIDRLWMPVFYQAGVPIPIPLFYDELALEYLGLEDLELQAHVGFPQPHVDFVAYLKVLLQIYHFVTDPNARIKPEEVPKDADLNFFLSRCFIRLPSYLGGKVIGVDEDRFVDVRAFELVADLLNAIKFLKLSDVLRVLPARVKSGTQAVSLGPVGMIAEWAITDEANLDATLARLQIPHERYAALHAFHPHASAPGDALDILLAGKCDVGALAGIAAVFSLRADSARAFTAAFGFDGYLGVLRYSSRGAVRVGQPGALPVVLAGRNELEFAGVSILEGEFEAGFDVDTIVVQGGFKLLPVDFPFNIRSLKPISGAVSDRGLAIDAEVASTLGSIPLASATVHLSSSRFFFESTFLGQQLLLDVTAAASTLTLRGRAQLPPLGAEVTVNVDRAARSGSLRIAGGLAGGLEFEITSELPKPRGSLAVSVLGKTLFQGSAQAVNGQFSLAGTVNVFPPGSSVQFGVSASGSFGSKGVYLSGGGGTNFRFGSIGLFEVNVSTTISSGGLSIGSTIGVLAVRVRGRAGIGKFRDVVCFCGHYSGDFGVGWLSFHVDAYIAVGPGVIVASFSRPPNWPNWAQARRQAAASRVAGPRRSLPPTLERPDILAVVEDLLRHGIAVGAGVESRALPGALQIAVLYGLSFIETVDDTEGEIVRRVEIAETHLDDCVVRSFRTRRSLARDRVARLVFESRSKGAKPVSTRTYAVDATGAEAGAPNNP